ncbi:hypothetical protein BDB01DRAFT_11778 [Pilobolus umbonatus]|nr:hypothetical protein BDB01DRAFT_11778 [Pilobolus umbonatus]
MSMKQIMTLYETIILNWINLIPWIYSVDILSGYTQWIYSVGILTILFIAFPIILGDRVCGCINYSTLSWNRYRI